MIYGNDIGNRAPKVLSPVTLGLSVLAHIVLFTGFALFAFVRFSPKELAIPIELTVVVNENLDGVEDEPPPLVENPPEPVAEPPPPEPPKPKVEELPDIKDVKEAVELKPMDPPKPPETPKPEPPKPKPQTPPKPKPPDPPKPPEKPKETMEDRMRRMRESATVSNAKVTVQVKDRPSGNGRTEKKTLSDAELRRLLGAGYKPGATTQLAASDLQLGVSLVQMALDERWKALQPAIGKTGYVQISVKFATSGRMVDIKLAKSCGDKVSDNAALKVVRSVGIVRGLPADFIKQFSREPLIIRYKVERQ